MFLINFSHTLNLIVVVDTSYYLINTTNRNYWILIRKLIIMADIHEKLYDASGGGDLTRVRELLGAGANPNKYKDCVGDTALLEAAYRDRYSIGSTLIQHGAALDTQNKKGNNALHCAAERGNNRIVSLLIHSGADMSVQNIDGNTALHRAAVEGHMEVVLTLVKSGADLNVQDKKGYTALHWAARKGHNSLVSTLLKAGADPTIQTKKGETPLRVAKNDEIVRLV